MASPATRAGDLSGRRTTTPQSPLRILVALLLAVLSLPLLSASASAVPVTGIVIDGNRTGPSDWASLTAGDAGYTAYSDPFATSKPKVEDDIFLGSHEAHLPATWRTASGGTDTGSDIGQTYSFTTIDGLGDVWFYLGFARQAEGVGAFAVELNQLGNDASGMPDRSDDDVRITFRQDNGSSALAQVGADRWNDTTDQWESAGLSAADYAGAAGESGLFAELGIDLSSAGLQPACGEGFTQVNLRSRASDSDSSLKDYVQALDVNITARCKNITVEKLDRTAGDTPLTGASFQLFRDNGNDRLDADDTQVGSVGSEQAADDGVSDNTHTWSDLSWGTYFVKESTLPVGYEPDPAATDDAQKVVLGAGMSTDTAVVQFRNPQTMAQIRVEKYDASNGNAPLSGAKFQLYKDDGDNTFENVADQAIGTVVEANDGPADNTYTWQQKLEYGTYFVEETGRPAGYDVDPDATHGAKRVVLTPGDAGTTVEVAFHNPQYTPQIQVQKLDAAGAPLAGASFQLFADTNDSSVLDAGDLPVGGPVPADQGGAHNTYTWSTGLSWGDYFVQETGMPVGYDVDPAATGAGAFASAKPVTVSPTTPDGIATVTFNNPRKTAGITVVKKDLDTMAALTGAGFTLYHDDGTVAKQWDAGDTEIGAHAADQGTGLNTYTWTALGWGDYIVRETAVPAGYTADTLADAAGGKPVHIGAAQAGTVVEVEFYNQKVSTTPPTDGTIRVTKTDADTGATVDGAVFRLYHDVANLGVADAGEELATAPTRLARGTYQWTGLPAGAYLVEEASPPPGYLPPTALTQAVTVAAGTHSYDVGFANEPKPVPVEKSVIVVEKYDADARTTKLDGATFQLLESGTPVLGAPARTGVGTYSWTDLATGDYTVKELTPPAGYLPPSTADASQDVSITAADAGGTFTVRFYNEPVKNPVPVTSTIVANKFDADRPTMKIDGATFQLFEDRNGNGVLDSTDAGPTAPARTAVGTYAWSGLSSGRYLVLEAAPPAGYTAPAQPVQAVSLGAGDAKSVDFFNAPQRTGIVVTKRDATTEQPIDTATFQLWEDANADGRFDAAKDVRVGSTKDTADGVVSWIGLRIGTYFVQETAAPTGYELPGNTVLTVRVDGANAGGTLQRSFYDPQKTTTLEVVKQDDDTLEVLAGATFQAYHDVDRDGTLDDGDVRFGDPRVTDADGVVRWPGLGFGHYLVEEVAPPAGYGLPETTTMSVVLDRDNAGGTVRLVFLDPALGTMSVSKVALERDAAGDWVASDGEVAYGDPVKYVITVRGDGARLFRDASVTDYIPGYDPTDSISTTRARYVADSADSADCDDADCAVSFDAGSRRLTWSLGDLRDEQRTLQFVVRTPGLPANPVFDEHGNVVDTIANVADLSWQEPASLTVTRRTSAFVARSVRSNTVVTTIVARPEVLDTPPAERPMPAQKPQQGLPDTGGPAHSDLITTAGGLAVLLGAWLMLVSRRRGCLPQR